MPLVAVALVAAVALWIGSLPKFELRSMNDLGLVSVTPPEVAVALGLVALAFVLSLRLQQLQPVLSGLAVLVLLVAVHALPSMVEGAPRQSVAYIHAGFTDEIERTGGLLTNVDARFSWPVFFALGALVTNVAGIGNAIELQAWAAPVLNLVYLVPLYLIYTSLSVDRRLVWTAMFVFIATNWVGQDYYSPQGFNYLLYLTVIAVLLRWFRRRDVIPPIRRIVAFVERRWPGIRPAGGTHEEPAVGPELAPAQRAALGILIMLMVAVSVASHQLTPFALLAAVTALTVLGRTSLVGLPVLIAVLIGMWISYMTVAYLQGHLSSLIEDVGAVGGTATVNVSRRLAGSEGHQFVVQARLVATAVLWLAAGAGALRRFRHGHLDLEAVALALVPFSLIAFQAYGGEMLLRVYLFSLPFMAFLVAGLFFPTAERPFSPAGTRALLATVAVMAMVLMLTKHGNERADWVSVEELAALDHLYAIAPPGSVLATVNPASPIKYRNFEMYRYLNLSYVYLFEDADSVEEVLRADDRCAFIFTSRTQLVNAEMYGGLPPGYWEDAEHRLIESGRFSVIFENRDATIFAMDAVDPRCQMQAQQ